MLIVASVPRLSMQSGSWSKLQPVRERFENVASASLPQSSTIDPLEGFAKQINATKSERLAKLIDLFMGNMLSADLLSLIDL